jgi:hypothetical protein
MTPELPRLDACLSLYSRVWDAFGTERFETGDLLAEGDERGTAYDVLSTGDPNRYLELLVAYGLLDRLDDNTYRVRCRPDGTERGWQEQFDDRAERLYDAARAMREERTIAGSEEGTITYRERTYASVVVEKDATVEIVAGRIDELVGMERLNAGIALRCPADRADGVQAIADDLTDPTKVAEISSPFVFEKVNSEVKGTDNDALQFRLYLAPVDRD